jgi:hypothetical protein
MFLQPKRSANLYQLASSSFPSKLTFPLFQFDAFYAPWTIRVLPVAQSDDEDEVPPATADPFVADLRPRSRAEQVEHLGLSLVICPPILAHAACFSFFARVERDPAMSSLNDAPQLGGNAAIIGPGGIVGGGSGRNFSRAPKTPTAILSSELHDRDFTRLLVCHDPRSSPGLPPLFYKGLFTGAWEGRFSFFDFDSYRDMLGGRIRSLYEGPFGDQPQVWKLEERIVKLRPGEEPGGKGSMLNAGFEILPEVAEDGGGGAASRERRRESTRSEQQQQQQPARAGSPLYSGWESEEEWSRRWADAALSDEEEYDPDARYEILLSGSVRISPFTLSCSCIFGLMGCFTLTGTLGLGTIPASRSSARVGRDVQSVEAVHAGSARDLAVQRVHPSWLSRAYRSLA